MVGVTGALPLRHHLLDVILAKRLQRWKDFVIGRRDAFCAILGFDLQHVTRAPARFAKRHFLKFTALNAHLLAAAARHHAPLVGLCRDPQPKSRRY